MPPAATATIDQAADTTASTRTTEQAGSGAQTAVDTSTQTSQQTDKAAGATTETAEELVSSGLMDQAEYDKVKDDPVALRKSILKAYTQKTQQLSDTRKALGNWADIKEAFEEDATAAMKALATQFGLEIREPQADTSAAAAQTAGDEAVAKLKTALSKVGLEELADDLTPIIREIAEGAAGKATEPIRTHQEQLIEESAQREANATLDAFGKKYPDWQPGNDVDKAMARLAGSFEVKRDPKTGKALISDMDYLEHLYFLATKDTQIAKAAQDAIDRMTQSAQAADTQTSSVTGDKVTVKAPAKGGFRAAYEAAKRGERWE